MMQRKRFVLASVLALVGLVFGLLFNSPLWAMESRSGEFVTVPQTAIIEDDLYVAGSVVTIDGIVQGDVIGAGRLITVNGTVEGDLIAAGQAIVINGSVNDDVRMAGQVLQLGGNARVGDDVVAAGASLESEPGSAIAGDVSFMGAQALLAGTVQQGITGAMASLELRGTIGEDVEVTVFGEEDETIVIEPPFTPESPLSVPTVASGLTVTDAAQIGGTLNYRATSDVEISPAAEIAGGINPVIIEPAPASPAMGVWNIIQRWITLLLVGALLMWWVPGWIQRLATTVQSKPLPSLGWGALTVLIVGALAIVVPGVAILLTAIVGSFLWNLVPFILGVGLLLTLVWVASFLVFIGYVPAIVLSFLGGQWLLQTVQPNWTTKRIVPLAIGLLIFVLLTAIPILGGVLHVIVILLSLGALWLWGRNRLTPVREDHPLAVNSR